VASSQAMHLAHTLVEALEEKKGEDILVLDISELTPVTDLFVLVSGYSDRMLDTLVQHALDQAAARHGRRGRVEGTARAGWVLVDFGDVILHVFTPDMRDYYDLEGLWSQGRVVLRMP